MMWLSSLLMPPLFYLQHSSTVEVVLLLPFAPVFVMVSEPHLSEAMLPDGAAVKVYEFTVATTLKTYGPLPIVCKRTGNAGLSLAGVLYLLFAP